MSNPIQTLRKQLTSEPRGSQLDVFEETWRKIEKVTEVIEIQREILEKLAWAEQCIAEAETADLEYRQAVRDAAFRVVRNFIAKGGLE